MDEKQQQFISDLAGLLLLGLQAFFHGQVLFSSTPSNDPTFQNTHQAVKDAKAGIALLNQAAQQ